MGWKERTVWGARHKIEEEEIERIINEYKKQFNIELNKLEASAIQAMRSQEIFWSDKKAKEAIMKLRGVL